MPFTLQVSLSTEVIDKNKKACVSGGLENGIIFYMQGDSKGLR